MPVSSYAQGLAWKTKPVGEEFNAYLEGKGVKIITWVWQAGGAASREKPLVSPEDAKGMKIRGGSREMDLMLQAAGAAVLNLPSNELYVAMQTGACDAGITSSTSSSPSGWRNSPRTSRRQGQVLLVHA